MLIGLALGAGALLAGAAWWFGWPEEVMLAALAIPVAALVYRQSRETKAAATCEGCGAPLMPGMGIFCAKCAARGDRR